MPTGCGNLWLCFRTIPTSQPASCLRILRVGDTMSSKKFISKCHRQVIKDDHSPRCHPSHPSSGGIGSSESSYKPAIASIAGSLGAFSEFSPKQEPPKWHARRTSKGSVPWITEQSNGSNMIQKKHIQISHNIIIYHNIHCWWYHMISIQLGKDFEENLSLNRVWGPLEACPWKPIVTEHLPSSEPQLTLNHIPW